MPNRWMCTGLARMETGRFYLPRILGKAGDSRELWSARASVQLAPETSLPGNIQFVLHCHMAGQDAWDNGAGANYRLQADAGIRLREDIPVQLVDFNPHLQPDQKMISVTVAVAGVTKAKEVFVEWSTDNWQTKQRTPCHFTRHYWDKNEQSNARNPNQYGVQVWTGRIKIRDAYRVEYAAGCSTADGELWDNNQGANYVAQRDNFKVLILNLHCYQEDNQDAKLTSIARAIADLDVDIVCLQEVAENWNDGSGDWNTNAARIVQDRIGRTYFLHTDWSHRGFDQYREGVAVLSKFPFQKQEARYVSTSQDIYDIHARKVVMAQVDVPAIGLVNVFSTHLSWWNSGFRAQFDALRAWADRRHTKSVAATLLCGDFNIKTASEGYGYLVGASDYEDQFLKMTAREAFDRIYRRSEGDGQHQLADDHRIDYVFMKRASKLKVTAARALFTDQEYGRVSDHVGYLVTFEPA